MSDRIAFGAAHDTHGSRANVSSEETLSLTEPRIFCWRRARVRSDSLGLHSLWRGGGGGGGGVSVVFFFSPLPRPGEAPPLSPPLVLAGTAAPPAGGAPRRRRPP